METTDSDERVMGCLARGQDAALGELMSRWEGRLWCFIDRMCAAPDATDDVYQEVWTRIFLYRKRYRPDRPFRPYLFAVALNCCRRALKRRRPRAAAFTGLDQAPPPVDPAPRPPERAIASEGRRLLHRAIRRLPEMQRSVVLLYLLFSADYTQIAQVLGRRPGTVRSHMHHALAALRGMLTRVAAAAEGEVNHERQVH